MRHDVSVSKNRKILKTLEEKNEVVGVGESEFENEK
jgi:hypothetical protein